MYVSIIELVRIQLFQWYTLTQQYDVSIADHFIFIRTRNIKLEIQFGNNAT